MAATAGTLGGTAAFTLQLSEPSPGSVSGSGLANLQTTLNNQFQEQLSFGTGSNQGNLFVSYIPAAIATSGTLNLDLYGHTTPLLDALGNNCLFLHIKFVEIWIVPGTGDVSGVTIGAAGSNPWLANMAGTTPTSTIYPGGLPWCVGEPTTGIVVSSSHGQLLLTNNSGAATVQLQIVIGGTTT